MNKTLYIFTRQPKAYAPLRIYSEAINLGLEPTIIDYRDLVFKFEPNLVVCLRDKVLKAPDIAIFRSPYLNDSSIAVWNAVFEWSVKQGSRVLNEYVFQKMRSFDKLSQHVLFEENDIPFVPTTVFTKKTLIRQNFPPTPFIAKSSIGSHGDKVWKINSKMDLDQMLREDAPFLVQPMLPNASDLRVIILGSNVIGAMRREAKEGSHLSNFSAGGSVTVFDLNESTGVLEVSENVAKKLNIEYGGLDLMQDEYGNWKVLEINLFCQFEGFEKATGMNVATAIINHLTN